MIWQTVKLGDVCDVRRGTSITEKKAIAGNVPVVAGGLTFSYTHNVANRKENTITVSASGANAGYVNYWQVPIFASDCTTIEARNKNIEIKYVYFFLKEKQNLIFKTMRSGAAQPHVYAKDIALMKIPLPPQAEQKRIVAILNKNEEIKRKREQANAKLDELVQSTFVEMFVNTKQKGWHEVTIQDCAENHKNSIRTGPFGSDLLHSEFTNEGVAVLGIDNAVNNNFTWSKSRFISDEKYEKLKKFRVYANDVLITIMGTCGRCAVVPDDIGIAINTKHLCCITLNKKMCLPDFLHSYFLMHPTARQYLLRTSNGAIMDGLNMRLIKNMPITLPPLNLQTEYSNILKKIQRQKEIHAGALDRLMKLFNSLQYQAFTTGFRA